MARQSPFKLGIAFAILFVITHQTHSTDTCRSGCHGSAASTTFKYAKGTSYKYNFDSKIELSLSSAENQKVTTEVKAQVVLVPQPQCAHILKVSNIQIISTDGKKHNQIGDIDKPIRFTFNDGQIDDQLCATIGDTQNSLNIKRAIISLFQSNLKSGHETDIFGTCPTDISQTKEGAFLILTKARNLNRCAYRENIRRDFLSSPFNLNTEFKSSPLLNSDYLAKQKIKNGILESATVTENYLYVPFSVGQNGAKVVIETSLKLTSSNGKDTTIPTKQLTLPKSIIFQDPHPVNSPHSNVNSILTAVKETAKTIGVTVTDSTAREFINLIKILRVSNKDDLLAVYNQVKAGVGFGDKTTGKKIFLDALLRAGNGDNIVVAVELLKNKELNEIEEKLVYLGLSFVRHTTLESLNAATELLNQANLPREAYLGIGSLAGKYCRQHDCEKVDAIKKLVKKLVEKLDNGKIDNRQNENDVIFVLKALRNLNHLNDEILTKITTIASGKNQPNRLRVAALETYLADPCKDKLRDSALSILKDIQQDSEVRIRAYLAAVQCPTAKVGTAIKTLLDAELSYQVGGFIVSHIRNARSSANPDKQLIKQHLGSISLPRKFPHDLRKWSSNGEFSYSIDTLGIANSLESNVIYSQNSFLPRTTSLNLTTELFGHSLNFFEIETRQENLDRLIEHYLGPKGILRSLTLQQLWDSKGKSAQKILDDLKEQIEKTLRARRDVSKGEIDAINKQVQIKTNELNKDLDLDLSVRAFGSELLFVNINDDVAKFTPDAIINKIINGLNKGLDNLKKFEETLQTNQLFLDVDFAYPSSSGFPLRLAVEGAANLQLKASGAIDVRELIKKDTTVKVSLIPSANIQVSGRLTIDTWLVENGLKVITNLHTSTGGDLIVQLLKNGVDVKFSLPVEKQNLISAKHDIVSHVRELGVAEVNSPFKFAQNKEFDICLDQLSPFIGLTFCAEVQGPNLSGKQVPVLPFPLAGDAKLAVQIEREDISQYHYRHIVYNEAKKLGIEITLETLANNKQKKVGLDISAFAQPEKILHAALTSPITNAQLEGKITETDAEKSLSLKLSHDNQEYFGKLGVGISSSGNKNIYKPLVQYKTPQDSGIQVPNYRVEGQVIVENNGKNTKYTLDNVKLIIPDQKTVTLNGNFGYDDPNTVYIDLSLSDGAQKGTTKGRFAYDQNSAKYNLELTNTINPDVGFRIKGEINRSDQELKNHLQLVHGRDLTSKTTILTLDNHLVYKRSKEGVELVQTENSVSYPAIGVLGKVDFTYKDKTVKYNIDGQYNDVKIGSKLDANIEPTDEGTNYKTALDLWALNNRVEIFSERKLTGPAQSRISNSLQVNGKKFQLSGTIKHLVKPQDIDVGTDIEIKSPTHPNPLKVVSGLKCNTNELDTHLKVSTGGTVYADAFLKTNKAGNANGSIKVNVKSDFIVNGQLKAVKGNGNSDLTIEIPSAKRTVKLDSTFNIHAPTYNLDVNLYPNFAQDKNKKISLSTQTKYNQNSIDSKNKIDIVGNKLESNIKATCSGEEANSKFNLDADLTLPNQHYFATKLNRNHKIDNQIHSGNLLIDLEYRSNKNTPGNKFTVKGTLKNTNPAENTLDIAYDINAESSSGKNLGIELKVKRQLQGDAEVIEVYNKLSGTPFHGHPLETNLKSTRRNAVGNYELKNSCPQHNLVVKGSYDLTAESKPISGDVQLELSVQDKPLKTLRLSASGSAQKTNKLHLQGQAKVFADGPDGVLIDLDTQGQVQANENEGTIKGTLKHNKIEPISVEVGYGSSETKESRKSNGQLEINYGKGQRVKGVIELNKLANHEYKLKLILDTPTEKYKHNQLEVHGKRNQDNSHHQNDISLQTDGKTWTINTDLQLSQISPAINVKVKSPEGKQSELLFKITKSNDRHYLIDLKVINPHYKNFELTGSLDANVESIDDFHIKLTANSPTLNWDKIVADAQTKPGKGTRQIQVNIKSGNKNILSGSSGYTSREEHGKLIVEGSGRFKLQEEQKSVNFKFIRSNLNEAKNGENGIEITFDAGLGNKAIDAELKITNKQFRILQSYCEEKKQCAHIEIDAKTNSNDLHSFNQEIEVAIDLRKLGLSHEFGLKAVTNRKEWILDHTVDVHFQSQDKNKYQYSLFIHPREAGASLTTPKRQIALEANINAPSKLLQDGGKLDTKLAFYLDKKNHPNQYSALLSNLNIDPKGNNIDGEIKFTNPTLPRPLSIQFNSKYVQTPKRTISTTVSIDVFDQANQKIVLTVAQTLSDIKNYNQWEQSTIAELKSDGLGLHLRTEETILIDRKNYILKYERGLKYQTYENLIKAEANLKQFNGIIKIVNVDLLKISAKLNLDKNQQTIDAEISSHGIKTALFNAELKNYSILKTSIARKDAPNDKWTLNAGLIPGQIADISSDIIKEGKSNPLGHLSIKLDEANFLKSDYALNSDNIVNLIVNPTKTNIYNHVDELQKLSNEIVKSGESEAKNLKEKAIKAIPNLTPIKNYYVNELKAIKEEIVNDKTIQDLSEFLHSVLAAISQVFGDAFAHLSELIENIAKSLQNTFGKVWDSLEKEWPKVKKQLEQYLEQVKEIIKQTTDIVILYVAKVLEVLAKFQPELKQLTSILSEFGHDVGGVLAKAFENVRVIVLEQWNQIYNELKQLPLFEQIRSEYEKIVKEGLPKSEAFVNTVRDIINTIKDLAPTEELKALVGAIGDYIEKKLTKQAVDDSAAIDNIVQIALNVIRRLTSILSGSESIPAFQHFKLPLGLNLLEKLPRFAAIKFSPLTYLLNEDVPSTNTLLTSLINHPRNWIAPFPLYALIAQGQHIFTFDGKHLTFPGKCNYLLVRDALDGNFSVVGSYENGLLTAITLAENNDVVITIKNNGKVLVNGAPSEYPARRQGVAAYYSTYEMINIESDSGVHIRCGTKLFVCSVTISGFYHGKLRGLLGNGNNEPYDDFTSASGKIVTSESEFGNSYKTVSSCPAVATVDHGHHHHQGPLPATCDKIFGWESNLRFCYPFVNVDNFKVACAHGVAAGVKDTEYALAVAYVAACRQHNIPVSVPSSFLGCTSTNGDKIEIGDSFSTKTPAKSADIVLIVDTIKKNEPIYKEYVQPLIKKLSSDLNAKGINDVLFHLIAYGGENQWPSHVTVNGKLTFKANEAPHLKFSETPKANKLVTGNKKIDQLFELLRSIDYDVKLALGQHLQAETYNEAIAYPFRPNSLKSILVVNGNACEIGRFYPLQILRTLLYRSQTINLNLITPFEKLSAGSKITKDLVGFNSDHVFNLKGGKGKENVKDLEYTDYCVDFTVKNGGNVFVLDHFPAGKGERDQFVQTTTKQVVEQFVGTEQKLDCECKLVSPFSGQNVCHVVQSKERKH